RRILNMDFPNRLSLDQAQDLERSFSKEEIKEAVWGCNLDKSPSPDGFTFGFYCRFWSLIEGEVVEAVNHFFNNGFCHKGGNYSFIALIPKTQEVYASLFKGVDLDSSLQLSHLYYHCRLFKWKMRVLSIGGRLTLLKSVLGSTPIYYVSMFKAPIHMINKLEVIRSHFFNGVDTNVRKMTFVKWDNVLASKEKSGLGVMGFYALNRALIFKWIWRFHTQGSSLLSRTIKAIHGEDGKIGYHINSSFPSNWIDIMCMLPSLYDKGNDLLGAIKKKVGNGENTLFWQEPWKGDAPFKNVFPRLYALESDKRITMAEKMTHPSLGTSFRCNPRCGIEQVQMVLENSFKVLKVLENSLEVLKVLENNLESMKLKEN
ncbi:hypothetical protein Tco_1333603, partial [Tanacetum coccineum]